MTLIFKPAIAISNSLRFKAKFSLLALMFYIPLIASFVWIVKQQFHDLSQYQQELNGRSQILTVSQLEQSVAEKRLNMSNGGDISAQIDALEIVTAEKQILADLSLIHI